MIRKLSTTPATPVTAPKSSDPARADFDAKFARLSETMAAFHLARKSGVGVEEAVTAVETASREVTIAAKTFYTTEQ